MTELLDIAQRLRQIDPVVMLILILLTAYFGKVWEFTYQSRAREKLGDKLVTSLEKQLADKDDVIAGLTAELSASRQIVDKMAIATLTLAAKASKDG
jgi:uncharacterized coiled-coil protein SlyX